MFALPLLTIRPGDPISTPALSFSWYVASGATTVYGSPLGAFATLITVDAVSSIVISTSPMMMSSVPPLGMASVSNVVPAVFFTTAVASSQAGHAGISHRSAPAFHDPTCVPSGYSTCRSHVSPGPRSITGV